MRLRFSSPVPYRTGCKVSYWFPTRYYDADDILKIQVGPLFAQRTETYTHATRGQATDGGRAVAGRFTVQEEAGGEYKSITFTSCATFRSQHLPEKSRIYGLSQPASTEPTSSIKVYIADASGQVVSELEAGVTFTPIPGSIAFGAASLTPTTVSAAGYVSMAMSPAHDLSAQSAPSLAIEFPADMRVGATCTSPTNNDVLGAGRTCLSDTIKNIIIIENLVESDYTGGQELSFTIGPVTLPRTTAGGKGEFRITTYVMDAG